MSTEALLNKRYKLLSPIGAGGMAVVPAGEWHWHGATPDSAMCHLSIRPGGHSSWPPDVQLLDWDTYMTGVREAG